MLTDEEATGLLTVLGLDETTLVPKIDNRTRIMPAATVERFEFEPLKFDPAKGWFDNNQPVEYHPPKLNIFTRISWKLAQLEYRIFGRWIS